MGNFRFTPLSKTELADLEHRMRKLGRTEFKLYEIYNGPSTRASTADIAMKAVDDLVAAGRVMQLEKNRWRFL